MNNLERVFMAAQRDMFPTAKQARDEALKRVADNAGDWNWSFSTGGIYGRGYSPQDHCRDWRSTPSQRVGCHHPVGGQAWLVAAYRGIPVDEKREKPRSAYTCLPKVLT
jgi:hypothetical protein